MHVYRNGIRIAVSTCSTGKKGHETPTGVFTVLQNDKDHRSSTYGDPWELNHPGMVLGADAEEELEAAVASLEDKRHPADWEQTQDYPVTTVVASTLDGKIDLIENGRVVAEGSLSVDGSPGAFGSHVVIMSSA